MSSSYRKMLVPQYIEKFKCIGPACEDSCCIGWKVTIDEETFKRYRKVTDAELKQELDKKVTRNRSNPSDFNYAKIRMENNGRCPFLNDESLCRIQLGLGEELLSITCSTYPRTYNTVNGILEKSATISCPEALRLALLSPGRMEFDYIEEPINKISPGQTIDSHALALARKPQKYAWELRIFTIDTLQCREYQLWERLIVLGLFYKKADELVSQKRVDQIPELIASYTAMLNDGRFRQDLSNIPPQTGIQMELIKEMADQRVSQSRPNQRYMECLAECLTGIGYTAEATRDEIAARYDEAYKKYYEPFMKEHEYILENYLVNYVFKNLFPFTGNKELFNNYVTMIVHYAMIKMHLIGMAGFRKEDLGINHVAKLIQSFAKTVEHNSLFVKQIYDILKENGYTTMAYMAILIKN
jgi:lysine-N-methylase